MTAVWVGAVIVGWLLLAIAVAILLGKHLHRTGHRRHLVDPADCPPWCARERAAALLRDQRSGL